jgi:hypothetical protein
MSLHRISKGFRKAVYPNTAIEQLLHTTASGFREICEIQKHFARGSLNHCLLKKF